MYLSGLPDSDGKLEVGLDLIGRANLDSAHRGQRVSDQREPGRIPSTRNVGRGQCLGAAQFGFGQQPQMGLRALTVHVLSVLRAEHSSFLCLLLLGA